MKGGDEMTREELGQLILSTEQQLYATAKTILRNDQDCADAIQESIVKAFSKVHTLRKDCYAKTWLIRILIIYMLEHDVKLEQECVKLKL